MMMMRISPISITDRILRSEVLIEIQCTWSNENLSKMRLVSGGLAILSLIVRV
jgi:hypothetical protein